MRRLADVASLREGYDLVIIGAGPAGMAAAATAGGRGLSVLWLDENPGMGGQVHRGVEASPLAAVPALAGVPAAGRALAAAAARAEVEFLPGATVWHLDAARRVGVSAGGAARMVTARRVIIATGALERPMPIPGWTLPGVMSVGAAQTLLKAQGLVPEGRVVMAGCGPLLWLYAAQLIAAGSPPALLLDTTPRANWRAALPHLWGFLRSPYAAKGAGLLARVRRGVRVVSGVASLSIRQADGGLEVIWPGGTARADRVLLHQGVVPQTNLAQAAGCELGWDEAQACFTPRTDAWGETNLPGIAIAGDTAGIAGAEAAEASGHLAALAALHALGALDGAARDAAAAPHQAASARWRRGRAFLDALYLPAPGFRVASDEAIACRCEEVTGAALREAVRLGATGPNQAKAFLRCGMGPCQGRMCMLTVVETIAAARGVAPGSIKPLRIRPPVKPVTLAEIAAMDSTEAERAAVEGR
ncbi:FAD/NAD(P)-dependent oxidoreductase [Roseococcus microcysteis]|uniref:FAD/NAD(P)-dependent oxidoreductase n=1 Tax=Roseococcus microcysteis TaxID=2771361 RepID=UPI00168B7D7C|nr:NAD(P)/FAD-dependent oxidoreductase [Roseococcus microcysteis]